MERRIFHDTPLQNAFLHDAPADSLRRAAFHLSFHVDGIDGLAHVTGQH